jgi:hypothetical protein
MKYKIVIFDLDGTILNTLEDLADSTNYALSVFDMPERTIEEIRHFVGNGIRKLMERAVPQGTPESMIVKVHETFTEHYKKHCADKTRPYDGIKELIENIRNAGVYTAVVSNKADYGVQTLCKDYFPGLFDYAVGEREGISSALFSLFPVRNTDITSSLCLNALFPHLPTTTQFSLPIMSAIALRGVFPLSDVSSPAIVSAYSIISSGISP